MTGFLSKLTRAVWRFLNSPFDVKLPIEAPYRQSLDDDAVKCTIVELRDIPPVEPNCSDELFLSLPQVFVIYQVSPNSDAPFGYMLLEMTGCRAIHGRGLNDEALHNHRFYKYGLQPYALQEVVNSPWIEEHSRYQHRDGKTNLMPSGMRHFVFALKEGSIDCLATGYKAHGPFSSVREACEAALDISRQ